MSETKIAIGIVLLFSGLTVLADVLIKRAADQNQMLGLFFAGGAALYALSSFGWFYALRTLKLSTLGGIYSLSTVVMLVLAGVIFFNEKLTPVEIGVVAVAILSIVMLWRFL